MKVPALLRSVCIILLLMPAVVYSQNSIQGVITDSLTSQPLVGANVYLIGTAFGAAANIEGQYRIASIPDGNYVLKISYIGYQTKELDVNVSKGSKVAIDAQLLPAVVEGAEVVITAQRKGQVSAINQQLNSNTIVNVVSEEKIQELPDANAAESIGRLPGVSVTRSGGEANKIILRGMGDQYTNVTIDGVRIPSTDALDRGVDLSTISQTSLAGIEVYKALTPDKDGDAIAGSVNLVTKKAPEERQIRATLKGGYNRLVKSADQYDFSLKYGERFLNGQLGIQLNGNIESKIRSNELYNINYTQLH